VLEAQFPETVATQPELLAHHYTEAGLPVQAIPYWQQAGQRAIEGSAHVEARSHLTRGLELLATLPDTPARSQQELLLQTALGVSLLATEGFGAPEVERVYTRARELCQQVEDTSQLLPVLWGLWWSYEARGLIQTARELAEQLLTLGQRQGDAALLLQAHRAMGQTLFFQGELAAARDYLERGHALYDRDQHHALAFQYGQDPDVGLQNFWAHALWYLGYPTQALERMQASLRLAQDLSHPFSLAFALDHAAWLYQYRQEVQRTHEQAESDIALSREQGFAFFLAQGTVMQGWALASQRQPEIGLAHMRQGLADLQVVGLEVVRPYWLSLLAAVYAMVGQIDEGLHTLDDALQTSQTNGWRIWEPELYRLKGDLALAQSPGDHAQAEIWFRHALDLASQQQAKSIELRAAMSLSRLWQQQGKRNEARELLAPIYGWFTEGFDTADLQEAKVLLAGLA